MESTPIKALPKKKRLCVYRKMLKNVEDRIKGEYHDLHIYLCIDAKEVLQDMKIKQYAPRYEYVFQLLPELLTIKPKKEFTHNVWWKDEDANVANAKRLKALIKIIKLCEKKQQ